MPYIKSVDRQKYDEALRALPSTISTKGELEYLIFSLMRRYMVDKTWSYTELHNAAYAAQHCCAEFRRRFLDLREDGARSENGDVTGEAT
jgi:hypothetical protein